MQDGEKLANNKMVGAVGLPPLCPGPPVTHFPIEIRKRTLDFCPHQLSMAAQDK